MKRFALLKLFSMGNLCLKEHFASSKEEAIKYFQQFSPVALDKDGYGKNGQFSYCVAEYHR